MKQPIRVLQVVTIMDLGGLENFLMTIYRNIDRTKVQFDFLVHRPERGVFDDEIEKLGGRIYRLNPIRPQKFFTYQKDLKKFFNEHKEYRVVHSHLNENSAIVLYVAKKMNVPIRIAHSHAKATAGAYKFLREFLKKGIDFSSTFNLACSDDAGKWLYGSGQFEVFKNSIDANKFKYPNTKESVNALKEKLNINSEDYIMGFIARFSPTKNHEFLIDVFHDYFKLNKNSKLLLIGEGDLMENVQFKINKLDLQEHVIFTGNVSNPQDYLSIMDLFVMTSFNEGMPVVLVEAQCNGLPILMSDTMPTEIELTDLTYRKSLNSPAIEWANTIATIKENHQGQMRQGYEEVIRAKHFDITSNAEKLINMYTS